MAPVGEPMVLVTPDNEPFVDLVQIRAEGSFGTGLLVRPGLVMSIHPPKAAGWLGQAAAASPMTCFFQFQGMSSWSLDAG